ncbi:MAG: hypothetical protein IPK19_25255 [Chloroflexi bacterium]|nr:hypothetical protein [Chloroflexota bacterium]
MQRTVAWLPRALLIALAMGIGLAVAARMRPLLTNGQVGLIALGMAVGAIVLCLLVIWLRRAPTQALARRLDLDFDLRERVSTALALIAGEIRTVAWLAERQIADAADKASTALGRLEERLPLPFRLRDWLAAIALLVTLLVLLILPNPAADALERSGALDSAIAEAGQTLEQIAEEVAADPALDAEERQALLEELRRQIEALENPEVSPEEAFAALSEMSAEFQEQSEGLAQRSGQTQETLEQMAEALREATGGEAGENGETGDPAGAMEQVTQNLEEISERAGAMTPEEQQRAAQALQDAAAALQQSNPQEAAAQQEQQSAAEALQNAAEALRRGDVQQMQQEMSEASQQLQQNANQAQQQSQSRQELSDAAQEAREAASEISQAAASAAGPAASRPAGRRPGRRARYAAAGRCRRGTAGGACRRWARVRRSRPTGSFPRPAR